MANERNHGGARPNTGGKRLGAGRKPKGQDEGYALRHTITLSPQTDIVVRQYMADHDIKKFSAGLDAIVREWADASRGQS